jgi:hypothetical protein
MPKRKPGATPKKRSEKSTLQRRASKGARQTSVKLSPDEIEALAALKAKTGLSQSAALRLGLQRILAEGTHGVPPSLGIADGIYAPTLHDDVVTLSNLVIALGYVVQTLDGRVTRSRRSEARDQLADVMAQLQRIAGRAP